MKQPPRTTPQRNQDEILRMLRLYGECRVAHSDSELAMSCVMTDARLEIERLRGRLSLYEPKSLEAEYGPRLETL